ncbi:SLC13 family permease, partial [Paracoccus aestuarii]
MTQDQMMLFALLGAIMALMLWGRWRYDLVAFAGLMAAVLLGLVPAADAWSGFGNPTTVIVALVLIATAGLTRSGAVARLARLLSGRERGTTGHILLFGGVGALLSGFMNNIAALAMLMPVDLQTSRKVGRLARLTLMPLAFATILGGMLTLIGTPPNLIVSGFRADVLGQPYRMFDFLPVGGAVALAGLAFVGLIGWRLIPRP